MRQSGLLLFALLGNSSWFIYFHSKISAGTLAHAGGVIKRELPAALLCSRCAQGHYTPPHSNQVQSNFQ